MSAGAYSVSLEGDLDARSRIVQRYVLRSPSGEIVTTCPVTKANRRWIDQEAANRNRMARERRYGVRPR